MSVLLVTLTPSADDPDLSDNDDGTFTSAIGAVQLPNPPGVPCAETFPNSSGEFDNSADLGTIDFVIVLVRVQVEQISGDSIVFSSGLIQWTSGGVQDTASIAFDPGVGGPFVWVDSGSQFNNPLGPGNPWTWSGINSLESVGTKLTYCEEFDPGGPSSWTHRQSEVKVEVWGTPGALRERAKIGVGL